MMTGNITLQQMRFHAHHGVMPQERQVGNDFEVTVSLQYPLDKAAMNDDLADTLNYAEVYATVAAEMATPSQLLEHVAGRIIRALRTRFVAVSKLTPPFKCQMAAVTVTLSF